jgi:2-polyprenyl-3-methyl-5-hydroxy-6-metoxy-1,4-benzoquinol methylase
VHQNPRPSVEELNRFYLQSQYHAELTGENKDAYIRFSRWYFSEKIDFALTHGTLRGGRVFDIGCGQGGVLKVFEERGWKPYGIEPDQTLSDYAMSDLGLTDVKRGTLDRHFELKEKVDLVFSNHAFEHFADLDEVMTGLVNILKPGGYVFIAVPTYCRNKSSHSKRWMNSAHYSLFTHNSLNNLLSRYGFEEVTHTYSGWKKEVDDLWYLGKFSGNRGNPRLYFESPEHVSRYLRLVNPLRSFIFCPIYSNWTARVRAYTLIVNAFRLLFTSPSAFRQKVFARVTGGAKPSSDR